MTKKAVIVFGGSSGIGEASARALLVEGRQVTITGRAEAKLAAAGTRLAEYGNNSLRKR
jgi:NADP-dependent 3-hydroxy acid dehydrogenase YdfG